MFQYENVNINYKYFNNNSDKTLVFLHGWGQNILMMEPLANPFKKKKNILLVDLPGFGDSEEPNTIWALNDYAKMLNSLINQLNIQNIVLIGHSFGGKIAIIYASLYNVQKLILLASPYKASTKKVSFKVKILKKLAKISFIRPIVDKIKRRLGSTDYQNATPMMRNILVKHVNTSIKDNLTKINCPTLIIWGTKDEAVDITNAYEIKELIADSAVIVYKNCTHYAYLEDLGKTIRIINSFIS